jgi:Sec-independent protein translocase protein TatA
MPFDGAFSPLHVMVVALVAFFVLGPDRLPAAVRQLGRFTREYSRVREHLRGELRDVVSSFDQQAREVMRESTDADHASKSDPSSPDEG